MLSSPPDKLDNLHARTGAPSFAFMTRGHTNDTVVPAWTAAGDAEDFLRMVFNKTTDQLSVEFELWSVGRAGKCFEFVQRRKVSPSS
jgi:hypothetical protein